MAARVESKIPCGQQKRDFLVNAVRLSITTACIDRVADCKEGRLVIKADCPDKESAEHFRVQAKAVAQVVKML